MTIIDPLDTLYAVIGSTPGECPADGQLDPLTCLALAAREVAVVEALDAGWVASELAPLAEIDPADVRDLSVLYASRSRDARALREFEAVAFWSLVGVVPVKLEAARERAARSGVHASLLEKVDRLRRVAKLDIVGG